MKPHPWMRCTSCEGKRRFHDSSFDDLLFSRTARNLSGNEFCYVSNVIRRNREPRRSTAELMQRETGRVYFARGPAQVRHKSVEKSLLVDERREDGAVGAIDCIASVRAPGFHVVHGFTVPKMNPSEI